MFCDHVLLVESGHTYEREAIEELLLRRRMDPITWVRIQSASVPNMAVRKDEQTWFDENPWCTPDSLETRVMLPATQPNHHGRGRGGSSCVEGIVSSTATIVVRRPPLDVIGHLVCY